MIGFQSIKLSFPKKHFYSVVFAQFYFTYVKTGTNDFFNVNIDIEILFCRKDSVISKLCILI